MVINNCINSLYFISLRIKHIFTIFWIRQNRIGQLVLIKYDLSYLHTYYDISSLYILWIFVFLETGYIKSIWLGHYRHESSPPRQRPGSNDRVATNSVARAFCFSIFLLFIPMIFIFLFLILNVFIIFFSADHDGKQHREYLIRRSRTCE